MAISTLSIIAVSVIAVKPTFAKNSSSNFNLPTPSVPEFTIKFENYSYTLKPIYSENPYTGQTEQTNPNAGEYRENESIEVIIQNQPFTPYWTIINGVNYTINLYFDVNTKGHFEQDWPSLNPEEYQVEDYASQYTNVSEYTNSIPSSGQIDFQVQAFIGYVARIYTGPSGIAASRSSLYYWEYLFNGTESGWGNTQTVIIPANIPGGSSYALTSTSTLAQTPTSTATVTPQNPTIGITTNTGDGFNWTQIALFTTTAVIAALVIAVVAFVHKRKTVVSETTTT